MNEIEKHCMHHFVITIKKKKEQRTPEILIDRSKVEVFVVMTILYAYSANFHNIASSSH